MLMLMTAATELEMRAFADAGGKTLPCLQLVTGIGPLETALSLSSMLHRHPEVDKVVNFGIAGACLGSPTGQVAPARLLDLCLAEQEIFGDLGIGLETRIERLAERGLPAKDSFVLDLGLRQAAAQALRQAGMACRLGIFVTVSCSSGTRKRARQIGRQFQGLCENMEGAAAARTCEHFGLPCLELRCISNVAGERDRRRWRLQEACSRAGQAAAVAAAWLAKQELG